MALFSKKQSNLPRRRQAGEPAQRATNTELEQHYAFRRNRTLTGSASSRVASTNESKADLKSPRVQAHELVKKRRHLGAILGFVALCAVALGMLISQFTASVVVQANNDISMQLDATYEKTIQKYFAQQPIERLRFLLDVEHLTEYLQVVSPEIQTIETVDSAGFGASSFSVTMRAPIAGWSINGRQQYVDGVGISFARNYYTSPSVQIIDKSGIQVEAGQAVASNRFLGFVGQVVGIAKSEGYIVKQVIIPRSTTRQIEVRLQDVSYPIKLSVDRPAGEQVEDMERTVKWMTERRLKPRYVDVRISGRAFYR